MIEIQSGTPNAYYDQVFIGVVGKYDFFADLLNPSTPKQNQMLFCWPEEMLNC